MTKRIMIKDKEGKDLYRVAYDDEGNPQDPCSVFCVHGVTSNRHAFDDLAAALVKAGRRVIKMDLPGHGESDQSADPFRYHIPFFAEDCVDLINQLGMRHVNWVGISMGGLIGIRAISEQNLSVEHLILVDVVPEVPLVISEKLSKWTAAPGVFDTKEAFLKSRLELTQMVGPLTDDQRLQKAVFDGKELEDGRWTYAFDPGVSKQMALTAQSGEAWNDWALFEKISCPVQLIRGVHSIVVTDALRDQMKETKPALDLVEVEGVGHFPALSDDYQQKRLLSFLGKGPS